ncbi:hypothetical protein QYM36_018006 [Artemia franciscana]|uniref:WW domain-containing protein n=1 Tax=Artemia franciscana TaxID=6661 RepID=A0AA88H7K7_ARTSF|nr:hypothetical protein QYM36_018006 [Artemia franciscana]
MASLVSLVSYADNSDKESDNENEVSQNVRGKEEELKEPTTSWQQLYDPNTGYPYYWNTLTNEITWEPPSDYLQYISDLNLYAAKMEAKKLEEKKKKKRAKKEERRKREGAIYMLSSYGGHTSEDSETEDKRTVVYGPMLPPEGQVEYGPVGPPEKEVENGPVGPPDAETEHGYVVPSGSEIEYGPSLPSDGQDKPVSSPDTQAEYRPSLFPDGQADNIAPRETQVEYGPSLPSDTKDISSGTPDIQIEYGPSLPTDTQNEPVGLPDTESEYGPVLPSNVSDETIVAPSIQVKFGPGMYPIESESESMTASDVIESTVKDSDSQTDSDGVPTPMPENDSLMSGETSRMTPLLEIDGDNARDGDGDNARDSFFAEEKSSGIDVFSILESEKPPDYKPDLVYEDKSNDVFSILESEKPPDYEPDLTDKEKPDDVSTLKVEKDTTTETPTKLDDGITSILEEEQPPDYEKDSLKESEEELSDKPSIADEESDSIKGNVISPVDDLLAVVLSEKPPDYPDDESLAEEILKGEHSGAGSVIIDGAKDDKILTPRRETVDSAVDANEGREPVYDDLLAEFYKEIESELKDTVADFVTEENKEKGSVSLSSVKSVDKVGKNNLEKQDLLAQFYAELETDSDESQKAEKATTEISPSFTIEKAPLLKPVADFPQPSKKKKMTKEEGRELMHAAKTAFKNVGATPVLAGPEDADKIHDHSQATVGESASDGFGQHQSGTHRGFGFHGDGTRPPTKKGFLKFAKGETLEPIAAGVFEADDTSTRIESPVASTSSISKTELGIETAVKDISVFETLTSRLEDFVERMVVLEVNKIRVDPLKILALQADVNHQLALWWDKFFSSQQQAVGMYKQQKFGQTLSASYAKTRENYTSRICDYRSLGEDLELRVSEAEPSFVAPSPVLADSNLEVEPICEDQSTSSNSTKRLMPPESNIAETSPPKKIQKSNLKSTVKKVKTKESKSKKKHPVLKMVSKWQEIQEQFK